MSRIPEVNLVADPPFQSLKGLEEETKLLRGAFGCFPTGVVAVSAIANEEPVCLIASSFVAVSIEPRFSRVLCAVEFTYLGYPKTSTPVRHKRSGVPAQRIGSSTRLPRRR